MAVTKCEVELRFPVEEGGLIACRLTCGDMVVVSERVELGEAFASAHAMMTVVQMNRRPTRAVEVNT